jgi:glutamine amidotransferase
MKKINIGIIDYDLGNQDSLFFFLKSLGYKVIISKDENILSEADVIILPGVGAFPKAMRSLCESGMDIFIRKWVKQQKPLIGICLGMQLLCSVSLEFQETKGLDLIPGNIIPFDSGKLQIGWNDNIPFNGHHSFETNSMDQFYYNHSYKYKGDDEYIVSYSIFGEIIPSIIQKNKVIGIQFHPEKSQKSGKKLINAIIEKLIYD